MSTWEAPTLPSRWTGTAGPTFVGRRREFDVLESVWTAVTQGSRQVVFVGGEAGVGKSRLMQVVATTLHGQGAAVLLGCTLADLSAPYEPFVEPIRILASGVVRGDLVLPEPYVAETTLGRLVTVTGAEHVVPEAQGRILVYDAVVATLRAAAAERPLVLVLEDLHWAGASTLELLSYVCERCAGSRLLILASHRSAPPDRSDRLVETIAGIYRTEGVRRLDLGTLDVEEIAEYVVLETDSSPGRARHLATRLRDHTGGNAFYLREVVRDLNRADPSLPSAGTAARVPESVRDTFERRLNRLGPAARSCVELGAVVGDDFTLALVAAAAALPITEALQHVHAGAQQGIVVADQTEPDRYSFVHSLARVAVLEMMTPSSRASGHAAVARCLEVEFPAAPLRIQRLAHHYAEAHVLGHAQDAVRYLQEAAHDARARLAHLEAAQHLERAARLSQDVGERDTLLLRAAEAYRDGGNLASAYERAREVALSGSATARLRAAIVFEGASWRTGGHAPAAVDLLTRVLLEEEADPALLLQARASLARALVFSGAASEAQRLGERCVGEARALEDPVTLAHVLETVLMVLPRPSILQTQLARSRELSEISEQIGDHEHAVQAASIRTMLCYLAGNLGGLEEARAQLVRASRLTGSTFHPMELHCYSFARAYAAGALEEAVAHSARLAEVTDRLVSANAEGAVALQEFLLRRETDRLGAVAGLVTGEESPTAQWAPGLLALYCELGMPTPARRVLAWLCDRLPTYSGSSTWPATLAFLAEAAVHLEDRDAAARLVGPLEEFTGCHLAVGPLCVVFGSADRHLGGLGSLLGRRGAEDLLVGAVEQERSMHAELFTGYALAALGKHLSTASPRSSRAAEVHDEAMAIARSRCLPRLQRILGEHVESRPDGLTEREVEVLRLISEGLSNRDLAHRLFISENTATNHVRSILLKTGSSNRTQAARYASAHRLVERP